MARLPIPDAQWRRAARLAATTLLAAGIPLAAAPGCGGTHGYGSEDGGDGASGGADGAFDAPPHPPPCDAGSATMCGSAVAPTVQAGCSSCSGSSCQPNGCYGGWWCDTSTNTCEAPPTSCPPSPCGSDSGGPPPPMDSGTSGGGGPTLTCAGPGSYTKNGGSCGTERWAVKTGTDPGAGSVKLVASSTTIATLVGLPSNPGGYTTRNPPTETTVYELADVTLTMIKSESDSDYHMVVSDGANTMIAEIPYPNCATGSTWSCFISRARGEVDARYSVSSSPLYPGATVTVRGVGFFDTNHGQTGVAPNAIELHPVLQICFGKGCTPS